MWEQSLSEIIGAYEGVIDYLHKVLGYAITGQSTEPLFLMLYGDRGRNGKTVIMETLKKVLGPYMGRCQPRCCWTATCPRTRTARRLPS